MLCINNNNFGKLQLRAAIPSNRLVVGSLNSFEKLGHSLYFEVLAANSHGCRRHYVPRGDKLDVVFHFLWVVPRPLPGIP